MPSRFGKRWQPGCPSLPVMSRRVRPVSIFPSGKVDALATALEAVLNNSERKVFVQPDHLAPLISLYRRLSVR